MWYELAADALDREACARLDDADPLAAQRAAFALPTGVVYLNGNSLGPLPQAAVARLEHAIQHEWGRGLVRSWNEAGWFDAPRRVGGKMAHLIGADADEVVIADSTSVNLFKLLVAALRLRPGRHVVVVDPHDFPTDVYVAQGLERLIRGCEVRSLDGGDEDVVQALDERVAVVALSHVDYKTARRRDLAAVTKQAHAAGALMLWDLSHSVGAMPIDVRAADVDLAVGCSYKYLSGGPGSPAFLYVARRLHEQFASPLPGWMGHAAPFEFAAEYVPAAGVSRALCGTPPILSLAALEAALDHWHGTDLHQVRAKSEALCELFIRLVEERCPSGELQVASPRLSGERGSHVALRHPHGYAVMQALIARGVIGDFRAPDLMRFGFAPLYNRFTDAWDAAIALAEILVARSWDKAEYARRRTVT